MIQPVGETERININHLAHRAPWAKKLNVRDEQLREAVQAVGDKATDVQMPLKGAHSTSSADRVHDLHDASRPLT